MCLFPKTILNPKYKPNIKNGGIAPVPLHHKMLFVNVGCNKCIECKKQRARSWQIRLSEDIKRNTNGHFITLTFSNKRYSYYYKKLKKTYYGYELDNQIAKKAIRHFLERWRAKYKTSLRHWLVTELGHKGTEHIHIHGIVWCNEEQIKDLQNKWLNGIADNGYKDNKKKGFVNQRSINYITKYITKTDIKHKQYNPIVLTSPGIGKAYLQTSAAAKNKFVENNTQQYYKTETGNKIQLPLYYKQKLYTDDEKDKLYLEQILKQKLYVMGEKVDISKNKNQYYNLLEYYQKMNNTIGYENNINSLKKLNEENKQRTIKQGERLRNNNNKKKN